METKQVKLNVNNKLDNKNNNTTKSDITVYEVNIFNLNILKISNKLRLSIFFLFVYS